MDACNQKFVYTLTSERAVMQADKKYQLADWRVRPLPEELLQYARADTHYLLYIYDRLKVCRLFTGVACCMLHWSRHSVPRELWGVHMSDITCQGLSLL